MSRACGDSEVRREICHGRRGCQLAARHVEFQNVPPNVLAQGAAQIAGAAGGAARCCKPGRWNAVMRELEPFSCDRPLSPLGPARSGVSASPWGVLWRRIHRLPPPRAGKDSKWLCPARAPSAAICAAVDKRHRNGREGCGSGGQTQTREAQGAAGSTEPPLLAAAAGRRPGQGFPRESVGRYAWIAWHGHAAEQSSQQKQRIKTEGRSSRLVAPGATVQSELLKPISMSMPFF
jgi:hypothetical protein